MVDVEGVICGSLVGDWVSSVGRRSMEYCLVGVEGVGGRVEVGELGVGGVFSGLLTCSELADFNEFGVEEAGAGVGVEKG